MNTSLTRQIALLIFSVVGLITCVSATPVSTLGTLQSIDSSFGADTLTRDNTTQLEWLDLRLTSSYSYSSITALLGGGQTFAGFRVATGGEVAKLIADSGIFSTPTGDAAEKGFFDSADLLSPGRIDDLGGFGCVLVLDGIVEPGGGGTHSVGGVALDRKPAQPGGCGPVLPGSQFLTTGPVPGGLLQISDFTTIDQHNALSPLSVGGIFLVRSGTVVPEPGSLPLAALAALAALAIAAALDVAARRRSK
jgi:hypothetical protein